MNTHCLEDLGLSKAEITIYLALLRIGATTTGEIGKETDLRKSTIYESLHRLIEKGLVSYVIQKKVKFFQATEPERLQDVVSEKKKRLADTEQELKALAQEIHATHDITKPVAEAHVFAGPEGFKTMRQDVLKHSKGELLLLGAISREDKVMPYFYNQWDKERIKKHIHFRILHKHGTSDKPLPLTELTERRYLPADIQNPVVINIYGDRVVSLIWKGKYPLCFMLINKDIADAYKKYFEVLWKSSS